MKQALLHTNFLIIISASWIEKNIYSGETLYPSFLSGAILQAMSYGTITAADFGFKGTQLKLTLMIDGKQQVVFKPAW